MRSLFAVNRYFARYRWYLILGILFTAISNVFGILPAQIVRYSFDLVQKTIDLYFLYKGMHAQDQVVQVFAMSILVYGVLIVAMALLRGVFLFLMRQTLIVMSRHIEYDQKNDIYAHYQTLPTAFYRRQNTGDLMARISEDVSRVRMYTGPAIMYAINLLVLFVMVIGYMLSVNVKLTIFSLLPLPLLSITIYVVNQQINKRSEQIQAQLSALSTYVQEAFSGIRVLKAFAQEDVSAARFTQESNEYRTRSLGLANVQALFFPVMLGMIGLSTILTVYVGGLEVQAGQITTGRPAGVVVFFVVVLGSTTTTGPAAWSASRSASARSFALRITVNPHAFAWRIQLIDAASRWCE
jgi:ATP-binding cassette subfamily B protein